MTARLLSSRGEAERPAFYGVATIPLPKNREEHFMALSMFQSSIPVFIRTLTSLKAILEKGAAHAQAKKIDDAVLLQSRLYPDMLPLTSQVQIAADQARGGEIGRAHV